VLPGLIGVAEWFFGWSWVYMVLCNCFTAL